MKDIEKNVKNLLNSLPEANPFGEKITLVGAVKTQTPEDIDAAVKAGICCIGDNRVQEFRDKYELISQPCERHFIGRLQTNKIKYLIGKIDLYHSVDRFDLADELSRLSERAGVSSDILLQVNIGREQSKGGFDIDEIDGVYEKVSKLCSLKVKGLMAMLPESEDKELLCSLAHMMRTAYDRLKSADKDICTLSMGMSGDYELCIGQGSNMIRLGTAIFGNRNYNV